MQEKVHLDSTLLNAFSLQNSHKRDEYFMAKALKLAEKGYGNVSPNPYVGAIIVYKTRIIGQGYHRKSGGAHAEIEALLDVQKQGLSHLLSKSRLYVTLEPCDHRGKREPCTEAIIQAGIKHVISAMEDPNPLVSGSGHRRLREAGIHVETGVKEEEARFLNRYFIYNQKTNLPYVTLKAALSLDGKLATTTGDSQWITGEEARRKTHFIRGLHDAILIGRGTLLSDNPSLTVRYGFSHYYNDGSQNDYTFRPPKRVLLASSFVGLEREMNLFQTEIAPTIILTSPHALLTPEAKAFAKKFKAINELTIYPLPQLNIRAILTLLYKEGIYSLMLEGGAGIYTSFLEEKLVNECALFYGPRLIGDSPFQLWSKPSPKKLNEAPILELSQVKPLGDSFFTRAFINSWGIEDDSTE